MIKSHERDAPGRHRGQSQSIVSATGAFTPTLYHGAPPFATLQEVET